MGLSLRERMIRTHPSPRGGGPGEYPPRRAVYGEGGTSTGGIKSDIYLQQQAPILCIRIL